MYGCMYLGAHVGVHEGCPHLGCNFASSAGRPPSHRRLAIVVHGCPNPVPRSLAIRNRNLHRWNGSLIFLLLLLGSLSLSLSRSKEEKSVKEKQQANLHTYERNSTIPPHLRRFCVCVFLLAPRLWLGEEERLDESAPSTLLIEYFIHIERMKSM